MGGLRQSPHNFRRVALLGWKDSKVGTLRVTAHGLRGEDVSAFRGVSGIEHLERSIACDTYDGCAWLRGDSLGEHAT